MALVSDTQEKEGGPGLARRLVDLYFTMFRLVVEGQVGSAAETSKVQVRRGVCVCGWPGGAC